MPRTTTTTTNIQRPTSLGGSNISTTTTSTRSLSIGTHPNNQQTNNSITVAVRIRPLNERELTQSHRIAAETTSSHNVILSKSERFNAVLASQRAETYEYTFDHAFGPSSTSKEIYDTTTKSMISDVLNGTNCTVFAYGATSAGKTHTMLGTPNDPGIIPRAMMDLFNQAAHLTSSSGKRVTLKASFMEIYNETIRDLLSEREKILNPCEEESTGVVRVLGITERRVENLSEIMSLLLEGSSRRRTEPTAVNQVSSRSHAILQVNVIVHRRDSSLGGTSSSTSSSSSTLNDKSKYGTNNSRRHTLASYDTNIMMENKSSLPSNKRKSSTTSSNTRIQAKLSLIDLAGSERAANTNNTGARLREGANINKSLLALANCINALSCGERVKYRDSKLTHVLKSSLEPSGGNNCRVTMIAAVTPSHRSFEESLNTLKYASRAKEIKTLLTTENGGNKISTSNVVVQQSVQQQQQQPSQSIQQPIQQQPTIPSKKRPMPSTTTTTTTITSSSSSTNQFENHNNHHHPPSNNLISGMFFVTELEAKLKAVEAERDELKLQLFEANERLELFGNNTENVVPVKNFHHITSTATSTTNNNNNITRASKRGKSVTIDLS
jgi:hypothetical protein